MKIKHICSFFALCCAMNIGDLSATPFAVKKAFEENINKHLKGHENSILRNCSYLNQINTTVELLHIAYESENFTEAIRQSLGRIKPSTGIYETEESICSTFDKLPRPFQVAVVYSFYFLTSFMNDIDESSPEGWIDTFVSEYDGIHTIVFKDDEKEETIYIGEDDMKKLVSSLKDSDLVKIVNKYYRDDEAVRNLKASWNSNIVKGDGFNKKKVKKMFRAIGHLEYFSACESFRKVERSAAIEEFKDKNPGARLTCSGDSFDILSDTVLIRTCQGYNDGGPIFLDADYFHKPLEELGFVINSARESRLRVIGHLFDLLDEEQRRLNILTRRRRTS